VEVNDVNYGRVLTQKKVVVTETYKIRVLEYITMEEVNNEIKMLKAAEVQLRTNRI
jgi:hypothetical protein